MNTFLIKNAFLSLKRNGKAYSFFVIQIMISFVLLAIFASLGNSLTKDYQEIKSDKTAYTMYLTLDNTMETANKLGGEVPTYSYEDYLHLKEKYSEELTVSFVTKAIDFVLIKGNLQTITMFFVSDEFFINIYQNEKITNFNDEKTIYLSLKMTDKITDLHFNSIDLTAYEFKDTNEIYNGKNDYIYCTSDLYFERKMENISEFENIVIMPIELTDLYLNQVDKKGFENIISIQFKVEVNPNILKEIEEYFFDKYSIGLSNISTQIAEFEEAMSGQIELSQTFVMISIISSVIVFTGFIGLVLITINNRKKRISMAIVTGASRKNIFVEFLLEIEFVILIGNFVGLVLSLGILSWLMISIDIFEVRIDFLAITQIFLAEIFIGFLISILAIIKITKFSPLEILRTN